MRHRHRFRPHVLILAMLPLAAQAQDISGLLLNVVQSALSGTGSDAFQSIATATVGRITGSAPLSPDTQGKVILYRTSWCGYCKRAAAYMQKNDIPFVERDIEASPAHQAEYTRLGGKGGVPFMVFGRKTMSGFSEALITQNYAQMQQLQGLPTAALRALTAEPALPSPPASQPGEALLQPGETLQPKVAGIAILTEPSKSASKLGLLGKADELVYMGEERDGFYRVTVAQGEGWVNKLLVKRP